MDSRRNRHLISLVILLLFCVLIKTSYSSRLEFREFPPEDASDPLAIPLDKNSSLPSNLTVHQVVYSSGEHKEAYLLKIVSNI